MRNERRQLECADVLREVQGVWMIGSMGGYGMRIVVDAGNDLGTLFAVQCCVFDAGRGASGTAEEIDVEDLVARLLNC